MADKDFKNQIEALLFSCGRVMDADTLVNLIGASNKQVIINNIIKLKQEYEERDSPLMIVEENESWKINVRERYLSLVRKIVGELELPKTILETLAVIAWRSPVLQSVVVDIRHNKAYDHIAELEELGFISKEKHGRSFIIKVTNKFFEYFEVEGNKGLKDIFKEIQMSQKTDDKLGPLEVYTGNAKENVLQEANLLDKDILKEENETGEHLGPLEVYDEELQAKKPAETQEKDISSLDKRKEELSLAESEKDNEVEESDSSEDSFGVGLSINDDLGERLESDAEDAEDTSVKDSQKEDTLDGLEEERHSEAAQEDLFGNVEEEKEKHKEKQSAEEKEDS